MMNVLRSFVIIAEIQLSFGEARNKKFFPKLEKNGEKKMVKQKTNIVHKIIQGNLESFHFLVGKLSESDCKKIYNRCYRRLQAKGCTPERIQSFINQEIEVELFKLMPKTSNEILTDKEIESRDEQPEPDLIKMHGVKLWNDETNHETNPVKELTDLFNSNTDRYQSETHCHRCGCSPCMCRES